MSPSHTIAFFGATRDCANHTLAAALRAEHTCSALARSPQKLTDSLTAKGITPAQQARFLTTTQGDVRDPAAVKQTLHPSGRAVDIIVSGIGPNTFYLSPNPLAPVGIHDSTICRDASEAILGALDSSGPRESKPLLINISTTGIQSPGAPRDVPLVYLPLYRWLLHYPHVDKAGMEANLRAVMGRAEGERPLRGFVNVKPTLLTGGEGVGWENVRFGQEMTQALGYFVARKDVGEWIFERLVRRDVEEGWVGGGVTLAN